MYITATVVFRITHFYIKFQIQTSYFDCKILSYHAVPGCQVSVDKFLGIKISHAICNLSSHLDHLLQGGWWTAWVVLRDTRQIFNL